MEHQKGHTFYHTPCMKKYSLNLKYGIDSLFCFGAYDFKALQGVFDPLA
jgi:hypothetical protein